MLSSTCSAFELAGHERGSNVARSTNLFTRRELLHLSPILHRFTIVSKWILVSKNANSEWLLSWGLGRIFLSLNQEFSFLWWFCSCFHLFFFPQRQVIFSLERKLLTKRQLCASLIEVHQNRNICPLQSSVIKSYREHWQTMPSRFEISSELLFVAHFFLLHFCFSITWHWLMATRQAIKCYSFLFCPVIDSRKSSVLIH